MLIEDFRHDLRRGFRTYRRSPATALTAIVVIAIGTGATVAMFSVINGLLLRPLPFPDPGRLVAVWSVDDAQRSDARYMSYPDLMDVQRRSGSLQDVGAWYTRDFAMATPSGPIHAKVAVVTPSLFPVLGVQPRLGRGLDPASGLGTDAVILSDGYWRQAFGADPGIIGREVVMNDRPHVVIGVMPADFQFPLQADRVNAWTMMADGGGLLDLRKDRLLSVAARLSDGVTVQRAQAELTSIAEALSLEYPTSNTGIGMRVMPLAESIFGDLKPTLLVLFGAVLLVLVIACATVANLLIVHGITRSQETAVGIAMGATRGRVVRQLLTEGLLLVVPGTLLGAVLGVTLCRALLALAPTGVVQLREIPVDASVLLFTGLLAGATVMACGLTPALRAARIAPASVLRDRSNGSGVTRRLLERTLVVGQVAVTFALVIGAGVLGAAFHRLAGTELGFDTSNVISMKLALPDSYGLDGTRGFYAQLQERIGALPGVQAVSSVAPVPMTGDNLVNEFRVDGEAPTLGAPPSADLRVVQPDYFATVGMRVREGRDFDDRDHEDAPLAVIVNDALVERYMGGVADPVGHGLIRIDARGAGHPLTIVGVVNSVRYGGPHSPVRPELYVPFRQRPFTEMVAVVRTSRDPIPMVPSLRGAVTAIDPTLPIYDIRTFGERLHSSLARDRFNVVLLALFAIIALVLMTVGLHGVMAQFIRHRRREIAIRVAFGATPARVRALVIGEGMLLVGGGLLLGVACALALTRVMGSVLAGVGSSGPGLFLLAAALLATTALLTCYRLTVAFPADVAPVLRS